MIAAVALVALLATAVGCSSSTPSDSASPPSDKSSTTATADSGECSSSEWISSWGAAPSDADFGSDPASAPIPTEFGDRTVRNVIAPHLGSDGQVRLHLTNRYNPAPVTFERVTIGLSQPDGGVVEPVEVTFAGKSSATAGADAELVSDPVSISFEPFEPLAISLFLAPGTGHLTKHWNANATTFITPPGAGDQTGTTSASDFTERSYSWFGISGLDVEAAPDSRAIVAFGDSITDGWVGASATDTVLDVAVADQNQRYPDYLQRRFNEAGLPISVINAGIGGNQILTGGSVTGQPGVERFGGDVPTVSGVRGVIVFEGINDLGLAKAPAAEIISGLVDLIAQARAADLKIWLATITPASDSVVDGVASAPNSETDRQIINEWIRTEADVDGVFDFDAAVRDASNPAVLDMHLGSIDRLHLSPAGYEKIAGVIDIEAVAKATC